MNKLEFKSGQGLEVAGNAAEQSVTYGIDGATRAKIDSTDAIAANLAAEAAARQAADAGILDNISSETAALQAAIDAEAAARQGEDQSLQLQVQAINGQLTYLNPHDFGTEAPGQSDLTDYALAETGETAPQNSWTVKNLFDGTEWIYNAAAGLWVNYGQADVTTATNTALGVVKGEVGTAGKVSVGLDGTMTVNGVALLDENGKVLAEELPQSAQSWIVGEFYDFRLPTLRPGFFARNGGLITDADTACPLLFEYLQTAEGQLLCKSASDWTAMSDAAPWNGIGGVPFYCLDSAAKTIRLPDTRGMYREDAGFDGLGVGGVHGDAIRNIIGTCSVNAGANGNLPSMSGALAATGTNLSLYGGSGSLYINVSTLSVNASRVVPTANKNQPRAFGVLACIYAGLPAV